MDVPYVSSSTGSPDLDDTVVSMEILAHTQVMNHTQYVPVSWHGHCLGGRYSVGPFITTSAQYYELLVCRLTERCPRLEICCKRLEDDNGTALAIRGCGDSFSGQDAVIISC